MKQKLFYLIKIASTILITFALGLEFWNIYLHITNNALPTQLNPILWLGSIALIAHVVEGIIAALNANSRDKNPIAYGIYTFFVGFVALQELFDLSSKTSS